MSSLKPTTRKSKAEIARDRVAKGVKISSREGKYLLPENEFDPEEIENKVIKQHLNVISKKKYPYGNNTPQQRS